MLNLRKIFKSIHDRITAPEPAMFAEAAALEEKLVGKILSLMDDADCGPDTDGPYGGVSRMVATIFMDEAVANKSGYSSGDTIASCSKRLEALKEILQSIEERKDQPFEEVQEFIMSLVKTEEPAADPAPRPT